MALEAAFLFLAPGADSGKHRTVVETPSVNLKVIGVKNYADAVQVAGELAAQGVGAIELCGGFGIEGTAAVKRAVQGKAAIGVVRFDNHPGIEFKSGDELF